MVSEVRELVRVFRVLLGGRLERISHLLDGCQVKAQDAQDSVFRVQDSVFG
jgi:hypothetical protein